jgi:hypothetical protein
MDPDIDFGESMRRFDTFLIGRKTFEAMKRMGGGPPTPGITNIVCSRTLTPADAPNATLTADAVATVMALKKSPGKDIALFGGGELFRSLLAAGVVDEVAFPIVVTETVTHIIWVDAESEDEALAYWADDWTDIPLKSADVIDGYLEFERPDESQRREAFRANRFEQKIGPLIQCPDCGKDSFRRAWYHDPYRKCHGPIQWKIGGHGKPMREYQANPVGGVGTQVAA